MFIITVAERFFPDARMEKGMKFEPLGLYIFSLRHVMRGEY